MRQQQSFRHATLFLLCCVFLTKLGFSDESRLKTGKALEKNLSANIEWDSVQAPLGDQLRNLQQQAEVAILLDRRIDPTQLITVKTESAPRVQVLNRISGTISEGAFCVTEHFAFVGRGDAVHRLPILIARNNDLANSLRKNTNAKVSRSLTVSLDPSWEFLDEPRLILQRLAKSAGLTIANVEAVPHDVWAERRLPKMTFVEASTMILNQFDLTLKFATDRPEVTIVAIDPLESFEHRYVVGSSLKSAITAAWQSRAPDVPVKWVGSNAIATTTLQQHALLNGILSDLQHADPDTGSTVKPTVKSIRSTNYQLKAERATLGELVNYFRTNKVPIDVADADSAETKRLLLEVVRLDTIAEPLPGTKFFPLIFGKHFSKVEVRDDRVILSRE